jgi:hypothetical protein
LKVTGSNLAWGNDYPDRGFRGFCEAFQTNARIELQILSNSLSPNHFIAILSELIIAALRKSLMNKYSIEIRALSGPILQFIFSCRLVLENSMHQSWTIRIPENKFTPKVTKNTNMN